MKNYGSRRLTFKQTVCIVPMRFKFGTMTYEGERHQQKMRLSDVAKAAGVSEGTVSLALNDKPGVSPVTRQRVLDAVKRLGYIPNLYAQRLATRCTNTIGLVVTDIDNPFFSSLTNRIHDYAREAGYGLMLALSKNRIELEDEVINNFISNRLDGVIVIPAVDDRDSFSVFESLQEHKIPFVFCASYYPAFPWQCVMTDLEQGSYLITKYLIDLGHRDIRFISSTDVDAILFIERNRGFLRAYKDAGLVPPRNPVIRCKATDFASGYNGTKKLLSEARPTAIMSINDVLALGAYKAIRELGMNVPSDISLVGYDDVIFSSLGDVPLTTVRQDTEEIAHESVHLLTEQIRTHSFSKTIVRLRPEIIVRASTGPRERARE